jgi:hypothetical protein
MYTMVLNLERYSAFLDFRSGEVEGNVELGSGAISLGDCPMKEGLRLSFRLQQVPYSSTSGFCILAGSYEAISKSQVTSGSVRIYRTFSFLERLTALNFGQASNWTSVEYD